MGFRPRQLLLALGNPLAGDDGFGRAVIDELRLRPNLLGLAEVRDAGTDLLREIDGFGDYDDVVLVDAVLGSAPAGEVAVFEEPEFAAWPATSDGCHSMAPLVAIALFRRLHPGATTRFTLIALQSASIQLAACVSAEAVARGVDLVSRVLNRHAAAGRHPGTS